MSDRSIIIKLDAKVNGLVAGLKTAQSAVGDYGSRVGKFAQEHRDQFETAGRAGLIMGTGMATGLGMAAKAAMDWESSWAGVTKTVDATPAQLSQIENGLRDLAGELPATHGEIAAVAEAAGQLGVESGSIVDFTKTMINLGETTNLSADEAATSIAQLMNVMGTAPDDVDNLGSALVQLGNNGASTEAEILEMAKRLSGMGKLVGASEVDILAMSNAMASVGISAEMGGGAMSRVMQDIYGAVQTGGEAVQGFADVAGVSAEEFSTAFKNDPVEAANMFVGGLDRIKKQGGNVVGTLADLGIKSTEETRVLLSLAGASDLLSESLKTGEKAWDENSALAAEAAKRYETTEAKIAIAWNEIKDAAIDAGGVLLPLIADVAETVSDLAEKFSNLPGPVKTGLTVMAGVGSVAAVAAGGVALLAPRIFDTIDGFRKLSTDAPRATGAIKKAGRVAGVAAGAFVGLQVLGAISKQFGDAAPKVEDFANALLSANDDLKAMNELVAYEGIGTDIEGIGAAMKRVSEMNWYDNLNNWIGEMVGGTSRMQEMTAQIENMDTAMSGLVESGGAEEAARSFRALAEAGKQYGLETADVLELMPGYREALIGMANDAGIPLEKTKGMSREQIILNMAMGKFPEKIGPAAEGANQMKAALEEATVAADGTIQSMDTLLEQMFEAGILTRSTRDAARNYEESLDALTASAKKNGATLDITTAKGRANQAAFDAVAGAGIDAAKAMGENGASQKEIQGRLEDTYTDLMTAAEGFGLSKREAKKLTREVLGIPDGVSIKSWMSNAARKEADKTRDALGRLPKKVVVDIITNKTTVLNVEKGKTLPSKMPNISKGPLAFADGGAIRGPGGPREDNLLIAASAGEHMLDAADVQAMGGQKAVYKFREQLHNGGLQPMAATGPRATGGAAGSGSVDLSPAAIQALARIADREISLYTDSERLASSVNEGNRRLASRGVS